MPYLRKSRRNEGEECPEHPDRNGGLKPTNGCLVCLKNYGRAQLKRRMTQQKNGGWNTTRGVEKGKCSVCARPSVKLEKERLSNGEAICETCSDVWSGADIRASSSQAIRMDMMEVGVPLVKGIGGE
jgi:hypothetical protein